MFSRLFYNGKLLTGNDVSPHPQRTAFCTDCNGSHSCLIAIARHTTSLDLHISAADCEAVLLDLCSPLLPFVRV